jgi:hypothetical protein
MSWAKDPVTDLLKLEPEIGNIINNIDYNYPTEKMLLAGFVLYYDFSNIQKIFILRDCIKGISNKSSPFYNWKIRATLYNDALSQPENFKEFFEKGYIDCMLFFLRQITKTYEIKLTEKTILFIKLIVLNDGNDFPSQTLPLIRTTPIDINYFSPNIYNSQISHYTIPKTCLGNILDTKF